MIALYCTGTNVRLDRSYPEPVPLVDEVVLSVTHCGICDTDVQLASGYMGFQGVLGHEFVGVDENGERYTAEINNACRHCEWCARGLETHCPNRSVLGIFKHDGAMAERVAVPKANLHMIPDSISDHSAVFIEPLAAAFQILEQLTVFRGDRVAVLGDGKLGVLCAWVLRTASEDVTLIGKHDKKLAMVGRDVTKLRLESALAGHLKAYDIVVDATGNASGLETASQLCRPRGTIVLKTTIAGSHQLNLAPLVIDEITLIGSRCGPFPKAIAALEADMFPVENLIEAVYTLDQAEKAFEHARQKGAAKVILEVSAS